MLSKIFIVHVLFKLGVFTLFFYHVIGLISRYVKPYLFDSIKQDRDEHLRLAEKDKLLILNKRRVEGQLHHQKMMFALLERNVQVWQKKVQLDVDAKEKAHRALQEQILQKRLIQERKFCLYKDMQIIAEQSVARAGQELNKRYNGSEGKILLDSMIKELQG